MSHTPSRLFHLRVRRALILSCAIALQIAIPHIGRSQENEERLGKDLRAPDIIAEEWYDALVLRLGTQLLSTDETVKVKQQLGISKSGKAISNAYSALSSELDNDERSLGQSEGQVCIRNITISLTARGPSNQSVFSLLDGPYQEGVFDRIDLARLRSVLKRSGIIDLDWIHDQPMQVQESRMGSISGIHRLEALRDGTSTAAVSCKLWATYEISESANRMAKKVIVGVKTVSHQFVFVDGMWKSTN